MSRDVAVQNASAIMADDEEAVEHGERDRGNREEIHRGDSFLPISAAVTGKVKLCSTIIANAV